MPQLKPAVIIRPSQLGFGPPELSPSNFGWHMLAEGDSWFSFGSLFGNNLLNQLRFGRGTLITSTASPGDTMRRMAEWRHDPAFISLVDGGRNGNLAWNFDAVLLSGGGNDLIDAVSGALPGQQLLVQWGPGAQPSSVADCVREDAWQLFEAYLRANFTLIAQLVGNSVRNAATPMFVHTYDYPTPNDAPGALGSGPWLLPAMQAHRVPPPLHQPLVDHLIERLAGVIRTLNLPNVHAIPTLGTLQRAAPGSTGNSNDWLNEIHPNAGGYRKLAAVWRGVIEPEL